jgi:alpha-1,3-rhamnosyl/mannosyltransferase
MPQVIVNGIPLLSTRSGVGNYVYHNFKNVLALENDWRFFFYYGAKWNREIKEVVQEPYVNVRKVLRNVGSVYPIYRWSIDRFFQVCQKFWKFNLYHETNYILMPFDGPIVATIYDLSFLLYPETHPVERVRRMERYFYPRLNQVSHFIAISEAAKQDIVQHLGLSPENITVTPLAVEGTMAPMSSESADSILSKYGLKYGHYILYVGTLEPRKNIFNLIQAYAGLSSSLKNKYPLVLGGDRGWLMENLERQMDRLGIRSNTLVTGYLPQENLPAFYSGASVFVYPSLYEGFGLPVLEAMACGTPVVTSNVSSIAEIVGEGGIQVDPNDVKSLRNAIERVIEDTHLKENLRTLGFKRAKLFSWENCARDTLDVYSRVLKG